MGSLSKDYRLCIRSFDHSSFQSPGLLKPRGLCKLSATDLDSRVADAYRKTAPQGGALTQNGPDPSTRFAEVAILVVALLIQAVPGFGTHQDSGISGFQKLISQRVWGLDEI